MWSSTSTCTTSGVSWERRFSCWVWWLNDFVGGKNDDFSQEWLLATCKRILEVSFSQLPICQWLTPTTQLNDPNYLYRRRAMVCAQAVVRKLPTATTHLARSRSIRSTASCHLLGYCKRRTSVDNFVKLTTSKFRLALWICILRF